MRMWRMQYMRTTEMHWFKMSENELKTVSEIGDNISNDFVMGHVVHVGPNFIQNRIFEYVRKSHEI